MDRGRNRQDVRAFQALYQDHYGFVWSTVRRMGVRPDSIDDAVQDAFLVAFRRWSDLPRERHRAWLYGIARRVSSNARRLEQRRNRKHDALRHRAVAADSGRRLETTAVIDGFLRALTPQDRELFVLGAIEGLSGRELAAALQTAPSTLHDRLQGLRRRFREEVGEHAAAVGLARRSRPRASAARWAVLLPQLSAVTASPALVMGGIAAVAASAVLAVVGATAQGGAQRPTSPPAVTSSAAVLPPVAVSGPTRGAVGMVVTADHPPEVAVDPTPRRVAEVRRQSRARGRLKTVAATPDPLSNEAALVLEIKRALDAGDAARARFLAERYATEHPKGALSDAAAALHIEALCQLGRAKKAQAQAQRHLRLRPSSPVHRRLSRGCPQQSLQP